MKGLFIPGITAEMFRNGCVESIEALMAEGAIYDVDLPVIEGRNPVKNDELVEIRNLAPGTVVAFGGTQWEILDNHFSKAGESERVFCLAKDILFYRAFDEKNCNDWKLSTLRNYLNGDFKKNLAAKIFENTLLIFSRDLISNDGLKDYGRCIDYISLISCDEYRKYRNYISNKSDWWWTITPWSTPSYGNSSSACAVAKDGSLHNNSAYCKENGIVPALCVYPNLKVRVV